MLYLFSFVFFLNNKLKLRTELEISASMSQKERDTPCLCGACNQVISKKQYSILCFSCDRWNHIKCVDLSVAQVKFFDTELRKEKGDRWNCPPCLRHTVRLSQASRKSLTPGFGQPEIAAPKISKPVTLEDIMIKLNHMEGQYNDLLFKYNQQIEVNESLQTEIAKLNSKVDHLEHAMEKHVPSSSNTVSSDDFFRECYERETRKKNVIIFGQPEPDNSSTTQQVDSESVKEILSYICPNVNTSNIVKVVRLGKILSPASGVKPRPIKIVLSDNDISSEVLRRSPEIRQHPQLKHLTITSDKTPRQQIEYKTARQQLLERRQAGETDIKIKFVRGVPAVVKVNHSEN